MIKSVMRLTEGGGSNMYLFADQRQLAASNPLDVDWLSGKGERVRLAD
jgi:hypothetical protein